MTLGMHYPGSSTSTLNLADLPQIIITINLVCQHYLNKYKAFKMKKASHTIYFNLTEFIVCVFIVVIRKRRMSSVVVVDDVSPVVLTAEVNGIRYRGSGVVDVPKTQHSVFLLCCVRDIDRKSKESFGIHIDFIYKKNRKNNN